MACKKTKTATFKMTAARRIIHFSANFVWVVVTVPINEASRNISD